MSALDDLERLTLGECNRHVNYVCHKRSCLIRGGWKQGDRVDYSLATCPEREQAAELAALRAERDEANRVCEQWKQWNEALRARVAVAELLLQKMCDACDTMPDDVAEWLHNEGN